MTKFVPSPERFSKPAVLASIPLLLLLMGCGRNHVPSPPSESALLQLKSEYVRAHLPWSMQDLPGVRNLEDEKNAATYLEIAAEKMHADLIPGNNSSPSFAETAKVEDVRFLRNLAHLASKAEGADFHHDWDNGTGCNSKSSTTEPGWLASFATGQ